MNGTDVNGLAVEPAETVIRPLCKARLEMIEACGRASQIMGLPRSMGQIYGLLYLSTRPICLEEIARTLSLSKASCSTGTRDLCSWNAIRQVWIQGDRKDHFVVEPELANLLRAVYNDFVKPRIGSSKRRLDRLSAALEEDRKEGAITEEEFRIMGDRLKSFGRLQKKLQALVPLAEKLL